MPSRMIDGRQEAACYECACWFNSPCDYMGTSGLCPVCCFAMSKGSTQEHRSNLAEVSTTGIECEGCLMRVQCITIEVAY